MSAAVRLAPQLADKLAELSERVGEGGFVNLLLQPEGDVAIADRGLQAAVLEVQEDFLQRGMDSGELSPADTGEWDWSTVSAGVVIVIRESTALVAVLEAVLAALGRNGVDGVLGLWEPEPIRDLSFQAPMIACRLRLAGDRLGDGSWQVDVASRDAMIAIADRWCRGGVLDGTPALRLAAGWVGLSAEDDVVARIGAIIDEGNRAIEANIGSVELRAVASYDGGLLLVNGGTHIEAGGWQTALAEFIELLRCSADHLAYGYLFRGWDLLQAITGDGLAADWPLRPGTKRRSKRPAADAEQANDIFGAQLLGPGYPNDLPAAAGWHIEQVGTARRLLTHADVAGWFGAPFLPIGQRLPPIERTTPPILLRARDELAPILSATPSV